MKYSRSLSLVVAGMAFWPLATQAGAPGNFARDRNIPVAERTPKGYAPIGVRLGAFTAYPEVEVALNHDDNIYYDDLNKEADSALVLQPKVRLVSGWSRHALTASLSSRSASYSKFDSENYTTWDAVLGGRLDIGRASNINAAVSTGHGVELRANPVSPRDAVEPIKYNSTTGHLGGVAEFNRFRFTGALDYTKYEFDDGVTAGGVVIDQQARNFKKADVSLRGDYAVNPGVAVYVVYGTNARTYVHNVPVNRDSDGYDVAVGLNLDLTRLVTGEVELGYQKQTYNNPTFKPTKGGTWKAKVSYYPTQLTTVTLASGRVLGEAPNVNASGVLTDTTSLTVDHELRRNLVLTGRVAQIDDAYEGLERNDKRNQVSLGARYLVSPHIVLKGDFVHSTLKSDATYIHPYKDNRVEVSVGYRF